MRKLRFVWFDDKKAKPEAYRKAIEAGPQDSSLRCSLEVVELKQEIIKTLATWLDESAGKLPDLVILDHVLNSKDAFKAKGSSLAHLLRGAHRDVPIVCVTAAYDQRRAFDQEDISEYSELFLYRDLADHIEDLYAIAKDFPKLSVSGVDVRRHIVDLLNAPRKDAADLSTVLPEEFRSQAHGTTEHRIAKWILGTLFKRPGFLYDTVHVATLLGLTEPGFLKVQDYFKRAVYRGVFATKTCPRWWASEVRRIVFDLVPADTADVTQRAGRQLPHISARDFSKCFITKSPEPPPEVVALIDSDAHIYQPVVGNFARAIEEDVSVPPGFERRFGIRKRA